jgi:hypothetical protein
VLWKRQPRLLVLNYRRARKGPSAFKKGSTSEDQWKKDYAAYQCCIDRTGPAEAFQCLPSHAPRTHCSPCVQQCSAE